MKSVVKAILAFTAIITMSNVFADVMVTQYADNFPVSSGRFMGKVDSTSFYHITDNNSETTGKGILVTFNDGGNHTNDRNYRPFGIIFTGDDLAIGTLFFNQKGRTAYINFDANNPCTVGVCHRVKDFHFDGL